MIDFYNIGATPEQIREALIQLRSDFDAHDHNDSLSKKLGSIIINGLIAGSSIYIPTLNNPLFSVDKDGNVKANSLERNDFHWFTPFESIDGYAKSLGGTGAISLTSQYVEIATGNLSGDVTEFQKNIIDPSPNYFTWDKNRKIKFQIQFLDNTAQNIWMVTGSGQNLNDRKLGFYLSNGNLYGIVANDSAYSLTSGTAVSANDFKTLEVKYIAGKSASFYVNKVLLGTLTTNLPSGTTLANWFIDIYYQTAANAVKTVKLLYWDFWQAN